MNKDLWRKKLTVIGLPVYTDLRCGLQTKSRYNEIPFEYLIFEDAGSLPVGSNNVINVCSMNYKYL